MINIQVNLHKSTDGNESNTGRILAKSHKFKNRKDRKSWCQLINLRNVKGWVDHGTNWWL